MPTMGMNDTCVRAWRDELDGFSLHMEIKSESGSRAICRRRRCARVLYMCVRAALAEATYLLANNATLCCAMLCYVDIRR